MDDLGNGCSGAQGRGTSVKTGESECFLERQTYKGGQGFQAGNLVTKMVKDSLGAQTLL